jgi:predicted ester cyclase
MRRIPTPVQMLALALLVVLVAVPAQGAASGTGKEIVRQLFASLNAGEMGKLDALLASDFVAHGVDPTALTDRSGFLLRMDQLRDSVPDAEWVVDDLIAEGDQVAARWTFNGTHEGEVIGVSGVALFRVTDGAVSELWGELDPLASLTSRGTGTPAVGDIVAVQRAHEGELLAIPGVVGVAIGDCEGTSCILVLVTMRTPEVEQMVPAELDGVRVEIEEVGPVQAEPIGSPAG